MTEKKKRPPRHRKWLFRRSKSAPAFSDSSPESSQRLSSFASSRPTIAAAADDGRPSSSALRDLKRVVEMIKDERHLVARELYVDARRRILDGWSAPPRQADHIDDSKQNNKRSWWKTAAAVSAGDNFAAVKGRESANKINEEEDENIAARVFLNQKKEEFIALENRANLFAAAKENLFVDGESNDWIHAQTLFGVSTSYRREASDGSLSVKIEGELHGVPLFEQLVVLRECDLYHTWAPFTSKSRKLAQLDKLDVVAWFIVGVPALGLTRDACYRAVGCDCMNENGSVLLVAVGLNDTEEFGVRDGLNDEGTSNRKQADGGKKEDDLPQRHHTKEESEQQRTMAPHDSSTSIFLARDEILSTLEIPPIPRGTGSGRMTIRNFSASIEILSPTAARTKMVVNIDPNLQFMPQFAIDFATKRMCGIILSRLQAMARKVVKDPVNNPHARRIREDVRFYRDWLYPKFRRYCHELGWQLPKVGAFEINLDNLKAEGMDWIDHDIVNRATKVAEVSQPCRSEEEEGLASSSRSTSSSSNGRSRSFSLIQAMKLRRSISQDDKIAAARTRVADRLRPEPFSESRVCRLNELKVAKQKATEERPQTRFLQRSGNVSSTSVASAPSSSESNEIGEAKHSLLIFTFSLCNLLGLSLLRRHSFLSPTQSTYYFSAHAFIDLTTIVLQAVFLRALLNCASFYAFENVDFGQKKLLKRMSHGKRLFVASVKKLTKYTSVSALAASCLFGFPAGRIIRVVCSSPDLNADRTEEVSSLLMTVASSWRHVVPSFYGTSFFVTSIQSRVCETSPNVNERWTSRALDISSFITLRLGFLALALVFMGSILSPKPRRTDSDARSIPGDLEVITEEES